MQRYELDAWLGDDHGLTDEQVTALMELADDINTRYPGPDNTEERDAALTTAYRLMVEDPRHVVSELSGDLARARLAEARALAALRQAATTLIREGGRGVESQAGFAATAGVDRMAVRTWLGLR